MAIYLGLMSGTSIDGVDAALVQFDDSGNGNHRLGLTLPGLRLLGLRLLGHLHQPMPGALRDELAALNRDAGHNELHRAALAGNGVAELYAGTALSLLAQSGLDTRQVRAIGAHGQTVRHRPGE